MYITNVKEASAKIFKFNEINQDHKYFSFLPLTIAVASKQNNLKSSVFRPERAKTRQK